eukprot:5455820-Ditylum_brightwellii.AAC.1
MSSASCDNANLTVEAAVKAAVVVVTVIATVIATASRSEHYQQQQSRDLPLPPITICRNYKTHYPHMTIYKNIAGRQSCFREFGIDDSGVIIQ